MKKFLIISIVLLIISGSIFGYSLHQYLTSNESADTQTTQPATEPPAAAPTEDPGTELNLDTDPMTDNGIFAQYYDRAAAYVSGMTKEQMVGQMIINVASSASQAAGDASSYHIGGVYFTGDCFDGLTKDEIRSVVTNVRTASSVSPILAVREEGSSRTDRNSVTTHALVEESFDSPRNTYESGGLDAVKLMEDQKAAFLQDLGFNLNLAPVVDLATENHHIMYSRSLCGDAQVTSEYAEYVVKNNQAKGVSVALKHFPGYGTINDPVDLSDPTFIAVDERDADTLRNSDYQPFKAGASAGARFIMISNVVVQNIDPNHTAALSPALHNELRKNVGFTGLIITDVLDNTDRSIYNQYADGRDPFVAAVIAGNDLILAKDAGAAYNAILAAVNDGVTIPMDYLKQACTRIIAYKYAAGLMN